MKYPHSLATKIAPPPSYPVPERTQALIQAGYGWFYQTFYRASRRS